MKGSLVDLPNHNARAGSFRNRLQEAAINVAALCNGFNKVLLKGPVRAVLFHEIDIAGPVLANVLDALSAEPICLLQN